MILKTVPRWLSIVKIIQEQEWHKILKIPQTTELKLKELLRSINSKKSIKFPHLPQKQYKTFSLIVGESKILKREVLSVQFKNKFIMEANMKWGVGKN